MYVPFSRNSGTAVPLRWDHRRMRMRGLALLTAALLGLTVLVGIATAAIRLPSRTACSSQSLNVHIVQSNLPGAAVPNADAISTVRCWVQARHVLGVPEVWISSDDQVYALHASVFFSNRRVLLDLDQSHSGWRVASVGDL